MALQSHGYSLSVDGADGVLIHAMQESSLAHVQALLPNRTKLMDADKQDLVYCEIYMIENSVEGPDHGKKYIGQAASHRLNHERYRPYGGDKRWKSHISQAKCDSPCKRATDFHVAIRKYFDSMTFKVIAYCPMDEADIWESFYIAQHGSLFPNGYNLTNGGRAPTAVIARRHADREELAPVEHVKRVLGTTSHSEDTRQKIADGIRAFHENSALAEEVRRKSTNSARNQHAEKKFSVGMDFRIDPAKLDEYISTRSTSVVVVFERTRNGKFVTFYVGKNDDTIDACKQRAMDYLQELVRRQATNQTNQTN